MRELNQVLLSEVEDFRKLGYKFLNGEVNKMDFKGQSGGMGVYAHRSGKEFMIRFRIPSGIASLENIKLIYDFAKKCNIETIHLTTRQAVQLHGISIDQVCDIMSEGIKNGLYSRGAGGNFPRNVAISPLSGVDKEEAFDVSPYALAVGEHFLSKIYTYKLPRKLKVSFSSSSKDDSHTTVVDLGFVAIKENGREYFNVYLGGGLGRNPKLSVKLPELVNPKDVIYHVEAMTELFINEGDYINKGRARIRYIMERMGKEEFINCYNRYLKKVRQHGNLEIDVNRKIYNKLGAETALENPRLFSQKQKGLYSVYVHPVGGQLQIKYLKLILDSIKDIDSAEIRLTMTEGLYIRNLNGKEAEKLLELTKEIGGTTRLEHSVACIGVPTCQMGVLNTQSTLREIVDYFKKNNFVKDILPQVHISGCPNSCSVHEIGEIGFCGKMKKVEGKLLNVFELHLGGDLGVGKTKLGNYYGDIRQEEVPKFLYEIATRLEKDNKEFNEWIQLNEIELKKIIDVYMV